MKNTITFSIALFLSLLFLQSCSDSQAFSSNNVDEPEVVSHDHTIMAVLYQQKAAEYRALCYQAFNIAKWQVDQSSKMLGGMKKKTIIVDIDETVLDNSPFEAKCILDNTYYPEGWDDWMNKSSAKAVPGALEFLRYAESQDVDVFYISNRKEKYRTQTLKNLQDLGFPSAQDDHLLLKTDDSGKKSRRDLVAEKRFIIMLIGDNLNDFSEVFENKTVEERFAVTDSFKEKFGANFIVLPNAMYGEWETILFTGDSKKSTAEKADIRYRMLERY